MPSSDQADLKAKFLCDAQAAIAAKILYSQAMIVEMENLSSDEALEYFFNLGPLQRLAYERMLSDNDEIKLKNIVDLSLNALREKAIPSDIEKYKKAAIIIKGITTGVRPLIDAICFIEKMIQYESLQKDILNDNIAQRRKELTQHVGNKQSKKAIIKSDANYNDDMSDLNFYKEIRDLLGHVISSLECEFVEYVELVANNGNVYFKASSKFVKLCEKNHESAQLVIKSLSGLPLEYLHFRTDIQKKLIQIQSQIAEAKAAISSLTSDNFVLEDDLKRFYSSMYEAKEFLKEFKIKIDLFKAAEQKHNQELLKQVDQRAKVEAAQLIAQKRIEKKDSQCKEHNEAIQRQLNVESRDKAKIANKEAEDKLQLSLKQERQDKIAAQYSQWQNEIKETRRKRDSEKADLRRAISQNESKNGKKDSLSDCKFRITDEVFESNVNSLIELFSADFKSISYDKAVSLIKRLGGTVDSATGSSHQKIKFNNAEYVLVDGSRASFVAGLPRPHNGETQLRRFELDLLRNAIRSVVGPERMENILTGKATSKAKLKNSLS